MQRGVKRNHGYDKASVCDVVAKALEIGVLEKEVKRLKKIGAGNETRTRDPDLGKVVLYQLSYSRGVRNNENSSLLRGAHYTGITLLCNTLTS